MFVCSAFLFSISFFQQKMADFILEEARNQEQIQKQKAMEMMEKLREEMAQKQEESQPGPVRESSW